MSAREIRAAIGLAGIFGLRMLGLFVILPVFALYAEKLEGGDNLTLVGVALGAYGLAQAVLQIPFGRWSDRVGRKPALYVGLAVFAVGSACAGYATTIYGVIAGRILQGAGAISAVAIAMAADLTRDEHRTKVMAIIGSTIGASFAASLIVGPWLDRMIGVPGIFYLIGMLAVVAIGVVATLPTPSEQDAGAGQENVIFAEVLADRELSRLNVGIFVLHAVLMSIFITVPFDLTAAGFESAEHWKMYAAVMLGSLLFMLPCVHYGDRRGRIKPVFLLSIALVLASQAMLLPLGRSVMGIGVALLLFFMGFMVLEAALPSQVSRVAPAGARGTAVAVYSTVQFLGAAFGSTLGGYLMQHAGRAGLLGVNGVMIAFWLVVAWGMRGPGALSARTYVIPPMDAGPARDLRAKLMALRGVREVRVHGHAGMAYLNVDAKAFDERDVLKLIAGES
ncbi:MAG: MFS transporter [Betaproteobacteria bacterium]|nr:MAG: MFS transporter [Betaproteobacteria bacterium]